MTTNLSLEQRERGLQDTEDHIRKVKARMRQVIDDLERRANFHDASKLAEPELSGYAALHARLSDVEYGTDAYKTAINEARHVVEHHYRNNDHHPDHHPDGIAGMNLMSLIEMLCDWKAAGERTKDGNIRRSLDVNRRRFGQDSQLFRVLENTAQALNWIEKDANIDGD